MHYQGQPLSASTNCNTVISTGVDFQNVVEAERRTEKVVVKTTYKLYHTHFLIRNSSIRNLYSIHLTIYNGNTIDYCSHNKGEKRQIKKLSVLRLDLRFLLKNVYF